MRAWWRCAQAEAAGTGSRLAMGALAWLPSRRPATLRPCNKASLCGRINVIRVTSWGEGYRRPSSHLHPPNPSCPPQEFVPFVVQVVVAVCREGCPCACDLAYMRWRCIRDARQKDGRPGAPFISEAMTYVVAVTLCCASLSGAMFPQTNQTRPRTQACGRAGFLLSAPDGHAL